MVSNTKSVESSAYIPPSLMEIARLQHGVEPPMFVKMEHEIRQILQGDIPAQETEDDDLTQPIADLLRSLGMDPDLAKQRDNFGRYQFYVVST